MKDGKHLTRERLAAIWQARVGRLAAGADAQPAEIDHVASCEVCRREWELLGAAAQDLTPLPALHNSNAAPGCPSEMRLQVLAGGTLAGEDADALLEHAASCDHCGAVLRDAARTFQNEISPEEQQAIGAMRSSQADWQKQLAARLSATPRAASSEERAVAGKVQGRVTWAGWALAAAAAVVLIIGASVAWRSSQTPDVNRLLAQAYTERRPMELRIAGAERAPIRVERGPGGSTMEGPVPLLEAESIISRKLAASPSDPTWLAARGRAELLNWNYEAAIKSLEQARDYGNDSPDLLIDLASAYFQRAEANSNRAIDYGHAIQLLGEVLGKNPAHPVALFNRAVACDRFFLYEQAIKDLNAFL